jgi:hypothetical protein
MMASSAVAANGVVRCPHRVAQHAASGAMRDLLEHHHASYAAEPLSEGTVFGLSGALALSVRIACDAVPPIDIEGRAHSLELDACRHLGLEARWSVTDDPDVGWERLRVELDAGEPTLLHADLARLDYYGERRHDTRHCIVATSWDPGADVVWVVDRRFPEPQRVTRASLAEARASRAWPRPARHGQLRLRRPARLADPHDAVAAALARVVEAMRCPAVDGHPHAVSGLTAFDALVPAWAALDELDDAALGATLAAVRFRIREGGTGGALYRSLQARFEHDAAALLESTPLGRAALACDDLADAWRVLAATTEHPSPRQAHRLATPCLERIRTLEHEHVAALEVHLREAPRRVVIHHPAHADT